MGATSFFPFICFWVTGAADLSADPREPLTRGAPTATYRSWEGQPPPQQQGGVQEGVGRTCVGQKEKLDGNNERTGHFFVMTTTVKSAHPGHSCFKKLGRSYIKWPQPPTIK